jgi:hypothetical protein
MGINVNKDGVFTKNEDGDLEENRGASRILSIMRELKAEEAEMKNYITHPHDCPYLQTKVKLYGDGRMFCFACKTGFESKDEGHK